MADKCFMVDKVMDAFEEGGEERVGAMMWRTHDLKEYDKNPRPFPHLGVMTKAGLICLDCPETDSPHNYWTRTGEPPNITVTPSLNVNKEQWHGFLTNGVLNP
jgi:hypothetical protein